MNKKISSPRQSGLHRGQSGVITLKAKYREGLQDLQDFNYVWIIFHFHLNTTWKPLVLPPRSAKKRGVFATRSPYRPNPFGISCVRIKKIDGLKIHIVDSDLIDGTPILDIKPYLVYCDSVPDASPGWTQDIQGTAFTITFSAVALEKIEWLQKKAKISLKEIIQTQLETDPLNSKKKRVKLLASGIHEFSYRTWRIQFQITQNSIDILDLASGYTEIELGQKMDLYKDKKIHQAFIEHFNKN